MKRWQLCRILVREADELFRAEFSPEELEKGKPSRRVFTWVDQKGVKHTYCLQIREGIKDKDDLYVVVWRSDGRRGKKFDPDDPYYRLYLNQRTSPTRLDSWRVQDVHGAFAPPEHQFRARLESYPWGDDSLPPSRHRKPRKIKAKPRKLRPAS